MSMKHLVLLKEGVYINPNHVVSVKPAPRSQLQGPSSQVTVVGGGVIEVFEDFRLLAFRLWNEVP